MRTDAIGRPLFDESSFNHVILIFNDLLIDNHPINVITSGGRKWVYAPDALSAAGVPEAKSGGYSKTLGRIHDMDKVKIAETPFSFDDKRKDRGSLISPCAITALLHKTSRGRNPIATLGFVEWMNEHVMEGQSAEHWSPQKPVGLEPVFREAKHHQPTKDNTERDPLAPIGLYRWTNDNRPLGGDEVQFCLCQKTCRCRLMELKPYVHKGDDVVDVYDDFEPTTAWPKVWAKVSREGARADYFNVTPMGPFGHHHQQH
ncbi:hypothetical protein [Ruegeria sp. HKCCA5014]|uniref:hypothetical protein n=1 Tax=Ruegeria sp. HKCCA5014 TaxID=2682980 RepID=UPI00148A0C26|nr:hypothetical protein [Ruegeria sp. HKCCA5014]